MTSFSSLCPVLYILYLIPGQEGDVVFSVPNSLVVTLDRVLGNETIGKSIREFIFFGLSSSYVSTPLKTQLLKQFQGHSYSPKTKGKLSLTIMLLPST